MKKYNKNLIKKQDIYFNFLRVFKQNCRYCLFSSNSFGICSKCFKYFKYFIYPYSTYTIGMKIISMSRYVSNIKEEILNFKLRNSREISKFFILSLFYYPRLVSDLSKYEYITYVPMDKDKEKYFRGYNQSKIIAKDLSMFLGIPVINLIEKVKKNKVQSSIRREDRKENVKDVYSIKNGYKIKSVLIIDDIYTTGATLFEIREKIEEVYEDINIGSLVLSKTISIKKENTSLIDRKYKYYSLKIQKKKLRKKLLEDGHKLKKIR